MTRLRALFLKLIKDGSGVTAIEYALIAALIAVAAIAAMQLVGTGLINTFDTGSRNLYPLVDRIWVKTRYTQSVREPSPIHLERNSVGLGSTLWSHPDRIRLDLPRRSSPERHRRGHAEI